MHTQGEWQIDEDGELSAGIVAIGQIFGVDDFACIDDDDSERRASVAEECESNRRLIAAAPEMFKWLEKVVRSDGAIITSELIAIQALLDRLIGRIER